MQQFFVVKPDGSRLGPFDGATISQMRLDGAIAADDTVEEAPGEQKEPTSEPIEGYFAPHPPAAKKMSPLFWVLIGVCVLCIPCIAIVAAILFPVFAQAKLQAKMSTTMTNLKQVGAAVAMYTVDNDDKFPPKMDTLSDAWPVIIGAARTAMPESNNPGHPEFSGNGSLAGTVSTKLDAPQRTYEFFDSAPWGSADSFMNKRVVGYADSSARIVKEEQFQAGLLHGMVDQ